MPDPHPLGFTRHRCWLPGGWRLRLNIWHADAVVREWPHTHRWGGDDPDSWSFISVPLWGRFVETRYMPVPGDSHEVCVAEHPHASRADDLVPINRGGLKVTDAFERRPLRTYRCGYDEIHTFVPAGSGWAVTLQLTRRPRSDRSIVWRPVGEEVP